MENVMHKIVDTYGYDPEKTPDGVMQFVVVSGSWYDMGRQYAMQCREALLARVNDLMAVYLRQIEKTSDPCNDEKERRDKVFRLCEEYTAATRKEFPLLIELLKGMADETGHLWQEMVLVLYGKSMLRAETEGKAEDHECSQIAAWDQMTENGHLIGAGNMDLPFDARDYLPAILAFPEDGYAFISSDMFHRAGLNEKGLMVQGSGGQNAGDRDMVKSSDRHMWNDAFIYSLAFCDSTEAALEHHKNWNYITGCNQGFGDRKHDVSIVEFTAAKYGVRRSGDFGEHDYILANNGYNLLDLQDSLMTGKAYWTDCLPRYWSAEQYIKEHKGRITPATLYEAQSLNRFYIPEGWKLGYRKDWENVCWYRDDTECEHAAIPEIDPEIPADMLDAAEMFCYGWQDNWLPFYNNWGLQCRDFSFRTTVRHVIDVDDMSFYLQKGCKEPVLSAQPDTTGTFCRIQLGGDVYEILDWAQRELEKQIWCAARDCMNNKYDCGQKNDSKDIKNAGDEWKLREYYLNEAKKCMYRGINYQALSVQAKYEPFQDESNLLAGKALTAFANGQCFARAARNYPTAFDLS